MKLSHNKFSAGMRCAGLAALAAGTLLTSSCPIFEPPPPGPGSPGFVPPPKYGFRGTESPNEPRALPSGREIRRDPNDTTVDVTPPPPRSGSPTEPPPTTPAPGPTPDVPPEVKPVLREDLPYGIPVVGKKGMVYSPYAEDKGQVDVENLKRGTRVKCPYTGKHFRVP
jgi:hypothetical protein